MKNNSYYSIVSVVNNPLSKESIAVGLIILTENRLFIKFSKSKIDFSKRLNPSISRLLDYSINKLLNFASSDTSSIYSLPLDFNRLFNIEFLNYTSVYNNNFLQFSTPSYINKPIDETIFNSFFESFIGKDIVPKQNKHNSIFKTKILNTFQEPLKNKIDIDYTVKRGFLGTFFSDLHLDGIGVNGSFYAAKSIDFNNSQLQKIKEEICNFESFIARLNAFASSKHIGNQHKYYIIADQYSGSHPSYLDLFSIIHHENQPFFKFLDSSNIDKEVQYLLSSNIEKVSERFSEF